MVDLYNKPQKGDEAQAMKARIAHLGDCLARVRQEEKDILLEMERLVQASTFGDQAGD